MPIGLFFCPSVEHIFEATRTAELIEVPFGVWTRAQGNMYWMRSPTKKGSVSRGMPGRDVARHA